MRILLVARPNYLLKPGGDTIQVQILADWLADNGIEVRISAGLSDGIDADLVHCFNISRSWETGLVLEAAARSGVPAVLSLIYQDLRFYHQSGRDGFPSNLLGFFPYGLARRLQFYWQSRHGKRFSGPVSGILAHSREEVLQAEAEFPWLSKIPSLVTGPWLRDGEFHPVTTPTGLEAVCVGRVEDLKNQKRIARAALACGKKIHFLGPANPMHRSYCESFRALVQANPGRIRWTENPQRAQIIEALQNCAFHVQASWFETAGLASLEALACDRPIICPVPGYGRTIFGNLALYADPGNENSIAAAMQAATHMGTNHERLLFTDRHLASRLIPEVVSFYHNILE